MRTLRLDSLSPAARDWTYAFLMVAYLLIFPAYARGVQAAIQGVTGYTFFYFLFGGAGLAAVLAFGLWVLQSDAADKQRKLIGLGVCAVIMAILFYTTDNPIEWEHYLKYGFLGYLLYRAFRHPLPDASSLVVAWSAGTIVGAVEEAVQWQLVSRVGEFADIILNLKGTALGILFTVLLLSPEEFRRGIGWGTARYALVSFIALAVTVASFITLVHPIGYTIKVPEGEFVSRFSPEDLQAVTDEFVETLLLYMEGDTIQHRHFQVRRFGRQGIAAAYDPIGYIHEAYVHKAFFDEHLAEGELFKAGVGYHIITEYFPAMARAEGWLLPEAKAAELRQAVESAPKERYFPFPHPNREMFFTSFTKAGLWWRTIFLVTLLWIGMLFCDYRHREQTAS